MFILLRVKGPWTVCCRWWVGTGVWVMRFGIFVEGCVFSPSAIWSLPSTWPPNSHTPANPCDFDPISSPHPHTPSPPVSTSSPPRPSPAFPLLSPTLLNTYPLQFLNPFRILLHVYCLRLVSFILSKPLQFHFQHLNLLPQVIVLVMVHFLQLVDHIVHLAPEWHWVVLLAEIGQDFLDFLLVELTHCVVSPVFVVLLLQNAVLHLHVLKLRHQHMVPFIFNLNVIFVSFEFEVNIPCPVTAWEVELFDQACDLVVFILLE